MTRLRKKLDCSELENSNPAVPARRRVFHEEVTVQGATNRIRFASGGEEGADLYRKAGISKGTYYVWPNKHGVLMRSEMRL